MRIVAKTVGLCVGVPALLWTVWNFRHSYTSLAFITLSLAAAIGAVAWTLRRPSRIMVCGTAVVLLTTRLALSAVTDEFGLWTGWVVLTMLWLSIVSTLILIVSGIRVVRGIGPRIRQASNALLITIAAFAVLAVLADIYATSGRYMGWYFMLPTAQVTIAGNHNSGYVHRADSGRYGSDLVVTIQHKWKAETYWVALPTGYKPSMKRCSDWTAPRFPVFSIGDVNQPCMSFFDETLRPQPPERNIFVGAGSVEFTADDGRRVRVMS